MSEQLTLQEQVARNLTDEALAQRLDSIADQPRTWRRVEKDAHLREAARRLRGDDALASLQHWTREDGTVVLSIKPHGDALTGDVVVYLGDDVIADTTP